MTPERWQQIKEILDRTMPDSPARRRQVIARACGDDTELLRDVGKFLELEDDIGDFIAEPLWNLVPSSTEDSGFRQTIEIGRRIDHYRIQRVLGRGGMGTVFLATREDDYQQQVALKVVSRHIDSERVMARFLSERQILANLHHPGIVQLLDGGTTPDGRPYLVMEYVADGEPIDHYCKRHELPLRARLELFRKVCEVVHFAHQNLVIHRDLKPSNILVTPDGEPRLLDFGIAKLMSREPVALDLTAESGPVPMTPSCASPEQFLNQPITTACDVYALGLLLHQLLTGRPPFELEGRSLAQVVHVVCSREPQKPSQLVTSPARFELEDTPTLDGDTPAEPIQLNRQISEAGERAVHQLSRQLAGDLDTITLKALRKDPRDRYGSAAEMADDIERHLLEQPVRAHQGHWLYYWGKFIRRNRLKLATAVLVILMVIGFAVAMAVQIERNVQVRSRADTLNSFLTSVFRASAPNRAKGEAITARDLLEQGRELIGDGLQDEPEVQAEFIGTLGQIYRHLGHLDEARGLYEEALSLERKIDPRDRPQLARALNDLAALTHDQGRYEESEALYRETLAMRRRLHGDIDGAVARTLNGLGSALVQQGKYDEAEEVFRESLATRRQLFPARHPQIASSLNTLGVLLFNQGEFEAAEAKFREALEIRLEAHGPEHTETATSQNNLGRVLYVHGEVDQAEGLYRQALEMRRRLLGEDHVVVAITERNLALLLLAQGELAEACPMARRAANVLRRSLASGDWQTAEAESVLGACLSAAGQFEEAEPYLTASFESLRSSLGPESSYVSGAADRLRQHYRAWNKPDRIAALERSIAVPRP